MQILPIKLSDLSIGGAVHDAISRDAGSWMTINKLTPGRYRGMPGRSSSLPRSSRACWLRSPAQRKVT